MFGSIFRKVDNRAPSRASDEVPFLADEEKDNFGVPRSSQKLQRWANWLPYSAALNIVLLIALFAGWLWLVPDPRKAYIPNEIYSPAQSAVEYQTIVFTGGLEGETSPYMGSSKEVDAKWTELYGEAAVSQIDAASAAQLPNATTPFNEDPEHYIVTIEVFHQIHCLNMMRKLVYPGTYPIDLAPSTEDGKENIIHYEHCYEQLRQSLQCHSDLSTIFWEWSERKGRYLGNAHTTHTCKNFDKIREWGIKNKKQSELDFFTKVEGAPIYKEKDLM